MRRIWLSGVFFLLFLFPKDVLALVNCEIGISPTSFATNTTASFNVSFINRGDEAINYLNLITSDSSIWTVNSFDQFSGGVLEVGEEETVGMSLRSNSALGSADVLSSVSTDAGGEGAVSCGNSISVEVVTSEVVRPEISNVSMTVSDTSATISWQTGISALSVVEYGTTASLGQTVVAESYSDNPSFTISGLSASTTYYYRLQSTASGGGAVDTNILSFTTGATNVEVVTTTVTNTVTNVVTNTLTNTVTKISTNTVIVGDSTPPVVSVAKLEKEIWPSSPVIEGSAIDNRGVARVEYRISGSTWTSASLKNEVGSKRVEWEALPEITLDGTYDIEVRALDIFGNKSAVKKIKVIIDNLPPTVGGAVFFVSEVALVAKKGVVSILEKQPVRAQFKELGGAERVVVLTNGKAHEAVKDKSTSIWNLEIVLDSGVYNSKIVAVDGAGKRTEKDWVTFDVAPVGKVLLGAAEVADYKVDIWKKDSYGKYRKGEAKKSLGWLVPAGEYYLTVQVNGGQFLTQVISFDEPGVLSGTWNLGVQKWWSRFWPVGRQIDLYKMKTKGKESYLNNSLIPNKWYGTKKIIYVTTPDLPFAVEGLMVARREAEMTGSTLVVVGLQSTQQEMEMWMAGKNFEYIEDWEGKWLAESSLTVLPTKYYLDTFGKVVNIKEGVY